MPSKLPEIHNQWPVTPPSKSLIGVYKQNTAPGLSQSYCETCRKIHWKNTLGQRESVARETGIPRWQWMHFC